LVDGRKREGKMKTHPQKPRVRHPLHWKTGDNQPKSPIGALVANAVYDDHSANHGAPTAFLGYYFHALKAQRKNAPGGAKATPLAGKATGFAFVAYPAEYRSSGVKTFVMSADGVIYEKDLGVKTESVAQGMKELNPGAGWKKTEVEMPSTDATAKKQ
jgi:hypothetical protein